MEITSEYAYETFLKDLVAYAKIDLTRIETDALTLPEYIVKAGQFLGNMTRDLGHVEDVLDIMESKKRYEIRTREESRGVKVTETKLQDFVNMDEELLQMKERRRTCEERLEVAKALFQAIATAKRKIIEKKLEAASFLSRIEQEN